MDEVRKVMDDRSGVTATTNSSPTKLRVDLADAGAKHTLESALAFVGYCVVASTNEAHVTLGDGSSDDGSNSYVYLSEFDNAPPHSLTASMNFASIRGAIARALSVESCDSGDDQAANAARAFVGSSSAAQNVRDQITRVAPQDVTVLICGESGTGKEVVARALHRGSHRISGPFVPVNCGAIPSELLESELFGHEKGAFTGAISRKVGRFELAQEGTLFLDEIGDMPYPMQVKLLRALENKTFEPVGSLEPIASDVRIVAATNSDLLEKIARGEFREDLYYRLNIFPIDVPPLRERRADIPELVEVLSELIYEEQGITLQLSQEALQTLATYDWAGNVRELVNVLRRLAIQYPNDFIRKVDLPTKFDTPQQPVANSDASEQIMLPVNGLDLKEYLSNLEKSLIEQALADTGSVVARAADRLHIRRTTLVEKMRKYGLGKVAAA